LPRTASFEKILYEPKFTEIKARDTKGAPMPGMDERISRGSFLRMGVAGISSAALLFLAGCAGEDDDDEEEGDD